MCINVALNVFILLLGLAQAPDADIKPERARILQEKVQRSGEVIVTRTYQKDGVTYVEMRSPSTSYLPTYVKLLKSCRVHGQGHSIYHGSLQEYENSFGLSFGELKKIQGELFFWSGTDYVKPFLNLPFLFRLYCFRNDEQWVYILLTNEREGL